MCKCDESWAHRENNKVVVQPNVFVELPIEDTFVAVEQVFDSSVEVSIMVRLVESTRRLAYALSDWTKYQPCKPKYIGNVSPTASTTHMTGFCAKKNQIEPMFRKKEAM